MELGVLYARGFLSESESWSDLLIALLSERMKYFWRNCYSFCYRDRGEREGRNLDHSNYGEQGIYTLDLANKRSVCQQANLYSQASMTWSNNNHARDLAAL